MSGPRLGTLLLAGARLKAWGLVAIVVAIAGASIVLASCGDNGAEDGALDGASEVAAAGVTLLKPANWALQDSGERGLVLALREEDLTAEVPAGPRLTVEPAATTDELPDLEELVGPAAASDAAILAVAEEPDTTQVGGVDAVRIGLTEERDGASVRSRHVFVNLDGIRLYQFLLEAPPDQWDSNVGTLEAILDSASFESAGE